MLASQERFTPDALGNDRERWTQQMGERISRRFVYHAGTGRLSGDTTTFMWENPNVHYPGQKDYDEAGNTAFSQTFDFATKCTEANLTTYACDNSVRYNVNAATRSLYDADGRLRLANRRPTNDELDLGYEGARERSYYDPYGRRVMRRVESDTFNVVTLGQAHRYIERYVWDGQQILYEIRAYYEQAADSDSGFANRAEFGRVGYVHGPGIDSPLEVFRTDDVSMDGFDHKRLFLHADWRGAITLGSWEDGGQDRQRWSAQFGDYGYVIPALVNWGKRNQTIVRGTRPIANIADLNFMGSLLSDQAGAAGLTYMRNRFYDPQTGRFTQEDPIGLAGGLNLYGFANGDPINFSDPFGLCTPWPDCWFQAMANWGARQGGAVGTAALNAGAGLNAASEALGTNDLGAALGEGSAGGTALALAGFLPVGKVGQVGRAIRNLPFGKQLAERVGRSLDDIATGVRRFDRMARYSTTVRACYPTNPGAITVSTRFPAQTVSAVCRES